jgi:topoisomerase-4 subunit A
LGEKFSYISEKPKSKLLFATTNPDARIKYNFKLNGKNLSGELNPADFVDIKGWKAMGNKLSDQLLTSVKEIEPSDKTASVPPPAPIQGDLFGEKLKPGDTIEF